MKWKVCGNKFKENLEELVELNPDYMGFIFYNKSPRYMATLLKPADLIQIPATIKRIGVFVNEPVQVVKGICDTYKLDGIQLHGEEDAAYVKQIRDSYSGIIIKVIRIDDATNFLSYQSFYPFIDYFLFDTRVKEFGGSGKQFDWKKIEEYDQSIPFFLSGGLGPDFFTGFQLPLHWNMHAVDINSRFEIEPGRKQVGLIKKFKKELNEFEISSK